MKRDEQLGREYSVYMPIVLAEARPEAASNHGDRKLLTQKQNKKAKWKEEDAKGRRR